MGGKKKIDLLILRQIILNKTVLFINRAHFIIAQYDNYYAVIIAQ